MKLYVAIENHNNDYDKNFENKTFYSVEALKDYLLREYENRSVSRNSVWWSNPAGTYRDDAGFHGWFKVSSTKAKYSLWLNKIVKEDGNEKCIVYEQNHYCSEGVYNILKELHDKIENDTPKYGDL